jgi:hypothetical protein
VVDGRAGELLRPLGLVVDEHLRQLILGRHERLPVAGRRREGETLLVPRAGLRDVASLAVDVAEPDQRIRLFGAPGPAIVGERRPVVGGCLVETSETPAAEPAVHRREREQAREPAHLRELHGGVELVDRLRVGALLEELRAAVVLDPRGLEEVGGSLGVPERLPQVPITVGLPAVWPETTGRVRDGERAVVSRGLRELERPRGEVPRRVVVAAAPLDARGPPVEQGLVDRRCVVEAAAAVDGHRLGEVVPQVVGYDEAPCDAGRQLAAILRCSQQVQHRLVGVAAGHVRLTENHLGFAAEIAVGDHRRVLDKGLGADVLEDVARAAIQERADRGGVAGRPQRGERTLEQAFSLEPLRRGAVQALLVRIERPRTARVLADESVDAEPASSRVDREPSPDEIAQRLGRALPAEALAQVGRDRINDSRPPQHLADRGVLAGEHLLGQIGVERSRRAHETLEHGRRVRSPAGRLDCQPHRRRPAPCCGVQPFGEVVAARAERVFHEERHFLEREGELDPRELEHLAATVEPLDGERRPGARGEHDVQPQRRLGGDRRDQPSSGRPSGELVRVVDHEHEVVLEPCVEQLAEQGRDRPSLSRFRVGGSGRQPLETSRDVRAQIEVRGFQGPQELPRQPRQLVLALGERAPRETMPLPPRREQRRLSEPCIGDQEPQPALEAAVEPALEPRTADDVRRGDDRAH